MTNADSPDGELEAIRREAWNRVLRLTSGHATESDILELERWCSQSPRHAQAFALASGRWRLFGPAIENILRPGQLVRRGAHARKNSPIGRRAFLGGALAASAAGIAVAIARPPLGLWPSLAELTADYRTAPGEQRQIALSKNVSVKLNTRTSLNIRAAVGDADRIELVSGEAAVATESEAIAVIAGNGQASARLARFNVRYDGSTVCVTCLEGLMQIAQNGRTASIARDQQITYAARDLGEVTTVDAAIVTGWREGDLYFQNEPLARVIDEINRYRSGRIVLMNDALRQRRFTAHFKLNRLEVVVGQLQATFGARVTSLPGGVVVIS